MKPHPIYTKAVAAAASSGKPAFADVSLTDTAKLIRATLKAKFPGIKFSVRSSRYAGGSSIDVRWNDGPGQRRRAGRDRALREPGFRRHD